MAEGLIYNDFAFVEAGSGAVSEIANPIRSERKIVRQYLAVFVWNLVMDEFPEVHKHLFFRS
jgi:hypothetical protein